MAENIRPVHTKKAEIVKEISTKLTESAGMVIAEYKNLTVAQMDELRNKAREAGIEVKVYKDSLVRRAAQDAKLEALEAYLTQQNVFIFAKEDGIAPAKLVANFAKENPDLILKAGVFEGQVQDTAAINEIAALPSKDELYSMFANSMLYPLRQFMNVVKAVADSKSE